MDGQRPHPVDDDCNKDALALLSLRGGTVVGHAKTVWIPSNSFDTAALAKIRIADMIYIICKEKIVVGRQSGHYSSDIGLGHNSFVSRSHIVLNYSEGHWLLSCNGKNGIFVNNEIYRREMPPMKLPELCTLRFPSTKIELQFQSVANSCDNNPKSACDTVLPVVTTRPNVLQGYVLSGTARPELVVPSAASTVAPVNQSCISAMDVANSTTALPSTSASHAIEPMLCGLGTAAIVPASKFVPLRVNILPMTAAFAFDSRSSNPSPSGTSSATNSCPASPKILTGSLSQIKHSPLSISTGSAPSNSNWSCSISNPNQLTSTSAIPFSFESFSSDSGLGMDLLDGSDGDANDGSDCSKSESDGDGKPPYSYAQLIVQAIGSTTDKQLTLSGIYAFITKNYPYYRTCDKGWQNSIRHNLSLNRYFIKVARTSDEPGKGSFWRLDPISEPKLIQFAFKKRRQRSNRCGQRTLSDSSSNYGDILNFSEKSSSTSTPNLSPIECSSISPSKGLSLNTRIPSQGTDNHRYLEQRFSVSHDLSALPIGSESHLLTAVCSEGLSSCCSTSTDDTLRSVVESVVASECNHIKQENLANSVDINAANVKDSNDGLMSVCNLPDAVISIGKSGPEQLVPSAKSKLFKGCPDSGNLSTFSVSHENSTANNSSEHCSVNSVSVERDANSLTVANGSIIDDQSPQPLEKHLLVSIPETSEKTNKIRSELSTSVLSNEANAEPDLSPTSHEVIHFTEPNQVDKQVSRSEKHPFSPPPQPCEIAALHYKNHHNTVEAAARILQQHSKHTNSNATSSSSCAAQSTTNVAFSDNGRVSSLERRRVFTFSPIEQSKFISQSAPCSPRSFSAMLEGGGEVLSPRRVHHHSGGTFSVRTSAKDGRQRLQLCHSPPAFITVPSASTSALKAIADESNRSVTGSRHNSGSGLKSGSRKSVAFYGSGSKSLSTTPVRELLIRDSGGHHYPHLYQPPPLQFSTQHGHHVQKVSPLAAKRTKQVAFEGDKRCGSASIQNYLVHDRHSALLSEGSSSDSFGPNFSRSAARQQENVGDNSNSSTEMELKIMLDSDSRDELDRLPLQSKGLASIAADDVTLNGPCKQLTNSHCQRVGEAETNSAAQSTTLPSSIPSKGFLPVKPCAQRHVAVDTGSLPHQFKSLLSSSTVSAEAAALQSQLLLLNSAARCDSVSASLAAAVISNNASMLSLLPSTSKNLLAASAAFPQANLAPYLASPQALLTSHALNGLIGSSLSPVSLYSQQRVDEMTKGSSLLQGLGLIYPANLPAALGDHSFVPRASYLPSASLLSSDSLAALASQGCILNPLLGLNATGNPFVQLSNSAKRPASAGCCDSATDATPTKTVKLQ